MFVCEVTLRCSEDARVSWVHMLSRGWNHDVGISLPAVDATGARDRSIA